MIITCLDWMVSDSSTYWLAFYVLKKIDWYKYSKLSKILACWLWTSFWWNALLRIMQKTEQREREKLRQQFAISILLIYMYLVCLRIFKTINFPGRKGRMGEYWIVTITFIQFVTKHAKRTNVMWYQSAVVYAICLWISFCLDKETCAISH